MVNELTQEQIWKEFEENGTLGGWNGDEVKISGLNFDGSNNYENQRNFSNKTLVFRDCPNLEHLSAYNHEIKELDLTDQKELTYLNVDDGKLRTLNMIWC